VPAPGPPAGGGRDDELVGLLDALADELERDFHRWYGTSGR
jgi:hypothetical protein